MLQIQATNLDFIINHKKALLTTTGIANLIVGLHYCYKVALIVNKHHCPGFLNYYRGHPHFPAIKHSDQQSLSAAWKKSLLFFGLSISYFISASCLNIFEQKL